jgi:ribokinase
VSAGVVGHVEWCAFLEVESLPRPGEIVTAHAARAGAGGGGAMAARALVALDGACALWTSAGAGPDGRAGVDELRGLGIDVHAQDAGCPQRRAVVHLAGDGERTITVVGERHVPRGPLDLDGVAGLYLCGGDVAAVRSARGGARAVVASPRAGVALVEAGVRFDAVVASARDAGEAVAPELAAAADVVVLTDGAAGGTWRTRDGSSGDWAAAAPAGPPADAYGCGDAFAAALALGLGRGDRLPDAVAFAARAGAAALTQRAPALDGLRALRG